MLKRQAWEQVGMEGAGERWGVEGKFWEQGRPGGRFVGVELWKQVRGAGEGLRARSGSRAGQGECGCSGKGLGASVGAVVVVVEGGGQISGHGSG